jgi:hypothetical protein
MCLAASQPHISQLAGSLILWTRAWTVLPPAVVYGGAITSHSPPLVGEAVANPKFQREDLVVGC